MAMIMDQHDKTSFREGPCKSFQAVLLHTGIAVRHRNRRGGTFGAGNEQPTAQRHAALDPELDIVLSTIAICFFSLCLSVVDPVSVGAMWREVPARTDDPRRSTAVPLQPLRGC